MQNIPDKRVSGLGCYLQAEYAVTGLTQSLHQSQGKEREKAMAFPVLKRSLVRRPEA